MTSYDDYRDGTLVHYQFLWSHEAALGRDEGSKRRPCAIILRIRSLDSDRIFLIPVTTKEPDASTPAIEIPELEARRMELMDDLRRWIVLNELNVDQIQSYVPNQMRRLGRSEALFSERL